MMRYSNIMRYYHYSSQVGLAKHIMYIGFIVKIPNSIKFSDCDRMLRVLKYFVGLCKEWDGLLAL